MGFISKNQNAAKPWRALKKQMWFMAVFGPSDYVRRIFPITRVGRILLGRTHDQTSQVKEEKGKRKLNLRPGDWVQIKPFEEILTTLDSKGKRRGLAFTKEMMKYCGGTFKVYKKLERIVLESTGEMRNISAPTVILENVVCDGEAHGNCDRTCFCFWREDWLNRVSGPSEKR